MKPRILQLQSELKELEKEREEVFALRTKLIRMKAPSVMTTRYIDNICSQIELIKGKINRLEQGKPENGYSETSTIKFLQND